MVLKAKDIKFGDIIYEYSGMYCVKSMVISTPKVKDGLWSWKAVNVKSENIIDYAQREGKEEYSKLYNYEAYTNAVFL